MTERLERLSDVFEEAIALEAEARGAFIERVRADSPDLANELAGLLAAHDRTSVMDEVVEETSGIAAGHRIGPYEVVRQLGVGGMGAVYLARRADGHFEHEVAVKVLTATSPWGNLRARFLAERQILAGLSHPNIARLLDGGLTDRHQPYFAMEYVDGPSVADHCDRMGLTVEDRLWLFLPICDAVEHAHQNLVVHRDIKPANVLVGSDGVPKLCDFGIAKLLDETGAAGTGSTTRVGVRVLTPDYASPEQMRGEAVATTSDVYQLGLLLRALLWGSPKDTDTIDDTVARARATTPEQLRRSLAGDLTMIVERAVRPEAERRYASAGALADDIRRHLARRPVRARPDTWRYRSGKFIRRNPLPLSLAAALLVATFGFGIGIARQAESTAAERDRAEEVVNFIVDLFGSANPMGSGNPDARVRDMLDAGAARAQSELAGQPETLATLVSVIAEGYRGLGLTEPARDLHGEALGLRRETLSPDDPELVASVVALARLEAELGNFSRSRALLLEGAELSRGAFPPGSLGLGETLHLIAHGWQIQTEYDRAAPLFGEAIETLRAVDDAEAQLAGSLLDFGYLEQARNNLDEAEALFRESLDIGRSVHGPDTEPLATTLRGLGQLLRARGDLDEADALLTEAMEVSDRALPADHPNRGAARYSLAGVRRLQGRLDEAAELYQAALLSMEGPGRPDPLGVANVRNDLGLALRDLGRLPEAEDAFRSALGSYRERFGEEHLFTATALANLATVLARSGRAAEAVTALERAVEIKKTLRPDHWGTAYSIVDLGIARMLAEDLEGAAETLQEGVELSRAVHSEGYSSVLRAENAWGQVLIALERYSEAETLLLGTRELERDRPPDDPFRAYTTELLVQLYTAWGRSDEAERIRLEGD